MSYNSIEDYNEDIKSENSNKELKDDDFFKVKADLKIILIGDSAVGKSK